MVILIFSKSNVTPLPLALFQAVVLLRANMPSPHLTRVSSDPLRMVVTTNRGAGVILCAQCKPNSTHSAIETPMFESGAC
ncbi:hypothetical protein B0F90DRAFT_1717254 [Multifurca ochricompacta]|uniref:Uncharacterized protein n=1 Tax=Multifurca ochricompacta TaxID=376703 RepID=A0AAD4M4T2_9AGAM|nr:hypothetical protein B0F90DRAFT_1717254 [Multifurca ochricompacta]